MSGPSFTFVAACLGTAVVSQPVSAAVGGPSSLQVHFMDHSCGFKT